MERSTKAVQAGIRRSGFGENAEAIFLTQGYVYDSAEQAEARFIEAGEDEFIYTRYGNPTTRMFEERMAAIEGTEDAFASASGMAAVHAALMSVLSSGDRVVSSRALFGSNLFILQNVLPRFGVDVALVDGTDHDQWRRAITPGTRAVFLESVSNPVLEVIDISFVSDLAHANGALVMVDNVLSTPVFQDTVGLGADVVIYSATKHIDGQGRCLGGIVLGSSEFIRKVLEPFQKHTGAAISPFNAWVMLKGLETIELRCNAQADAAASVAGKLDGHPKCRMVHYPHLPNHPQHSVATSQMTKGGTVVSVDLAGGKETAFRFLNALRIIGISNNLGDAKSLATHPATTTHQRLTPELRAELGIGDGLVRISLGLESPKDLQDDIEAALEAA